MTIAYAGTTGAFAHEACLAFAADQTPLALQGFADVIRAVEEGRARRGMLPVRNSRAGEVEEVGTLIAGAAVEVRGEYELSVRMHLLGLPEATLAGLVAVTSHPVALRQCANAVARLGLRPEPASNTAVAARDLRDPAIGVLASQAAATAYNLQLLQSDMQDDPNNRTVFAIIERR